MYLYIWWITDFVLQCGFCECYFNIKFIAWPPIITQTTKSLWKNAKPSMFFVSLKFKEISQNFRQIFDRPWSIYSVQWLSFNFCHWIHIKLLNDIIISVEIKEQCCLFFNVIYHFCIAHDIWRHNHWLNLEHNSVFNIYRNIFQIIIRSVWNR